MISRKLHVLLLALFAVACTKQDEIQFDNTEKKAAELAGALPNKSFQLTAFYSDHPIDFDQSDTVVKQETDLWAYVRPYIKDDLNSFDASGIVSISQGAEKIAGNDSAVIQRSYGVSHDKNNVYFLFVDYTYAPLQYKLAQFDSTALVVYVDWPGGVKLFSRFERKQ